MVRVDFPDDDMISEINMTPLVDISLVLVIIFMIIAPLFSHILKPLILPGSSQAALSEANAIKISIFPDGTMAVEATMIAPVALHESIKQEIASGKRPWIVIRAGEDVPHKQVMEAVKIAKKAGAERIAFAAKAKEESRP